MTTLPIGYTIETDADGAPWLIPPPDVTIFSVPGEGWLITDDFMVARSWGNTTDLETACLEYLACV